MSRHKVLAADMYAEVKAQVALAEDAFLAMYSPEEQAEAVLASLRAIEKLLGVLMYEITGRRYQ